MTPQWDPAVRAGILRIAGELIPADGRMPSAGTEEGLGAWLDAVAVRRPELVADLSRVVELVGRVAEGRGLDAFLALDDPAARTFADAVLEGYFASPEVRTLVGYRGIRPAPAIADEQELAELTAPVVAQGPRHRPIEDPGAPVGQQRTGNLMHDRER
jgi:hypothetical protein